MADDYTTKKKKMVADAERENAGKSFLDNERLMGRIPVGVSPEVEGGPMAGMTMMSVPDTKPTPRRAMVRGAPEGMTAEYYAPAEKPRAESRSTNQEAARAAVERLKKTSDERANYEDDRTFGRSMGAGLGAAIVGGLSGPAAPITAPIGALVGTGIGDVVSAPDIQKHYKMRWEQRDARRAIAEGLQSGAFTREELEAALAERNFRLVNY
jgi:hypothetical protein